MVVKILLGLAIVLLALMAYVRLAPNDPARFHVEVAATPQRMDGGIIEVIPGNAETLLALDRIARATPRTRLFAGSPTGGHVTYITRTAFWGFPDFTTVQQRDDQIVIYARQRFGRGDMGVNSARVSDWLQRVQPVE